MKSRRAGSTLSWKEAEFSPAEFACASGLNGEMQRHWRRRGLLPEKNTKIARFTARDMATVRLMMLLGEPQQNKRLCEAVAAHVIWLALADHPESWKVQGPEVKADEYRRHLEKGHAHIEVMTGVKVQVLGRYLVIIDKDDPILVPAVNDEVFVAGGEIATVINLGTVAARLIKALDGKPIITVSLPSGSKDKQHA